jgi:hypothetical protein
VGNSRKCAYLLGISNRSKHGCLGRALHRQQALDDGKPVSGAWTVGDNPRLLFFPHIKPSDPLRRARAARHAGQERRQKLAARKRFSVQTAAVAPAFYFASKGMVLPAAQNGGLPMTRSTCPRSISSSSRSNRSLAEIPRKGHRRPAPGGATPVGRGERWTQRG